jgi:hypothetical protein
MEVYHADTSQVAPDDCGDHVHCLFAARGLGSEYEDGASDGSGARAHQCRTAAHIACADLSFYNYNAGALHLHPERTSRALDERHREWVFCREYLVGDSIQYGLFAGELRATADLHLIAYGENRVRDELIK